MASGLTGAVLRGSVPVEPDRNTARSWAVQELSGRQYRAHRPDLLSRVMSWLTEQLSNLPVPHGLGSRFGLLIMALVAVATVVYAVQRSGGLHRQTRIAAEPVFGDRTLTATDHRAASERAERAEDWATAVVERFRAIARELEERAVLVPAPGRTADEVADEAGTWLPELAGQLRHAARQFDDVRYGDRPSSADAAAGLRGLDSAVRRAKPVTGAAAVTDRLVPPV